MRIYPDADVAKLSECDAGKFVRSLVYGEADNFGIVFNARDRDEDLRGIVLLNGEAPIFEVAHDAEQTSVLRYAGDVVWDIDHNGPLETNARHLFDKSGVLIRKEKGWFLNVGSPQMLGTSQTTMQLELATGKLDRYKESLRKVAMFGAWSLFIEEADRPYGARVKMASISIGKDT